MKRFATWVAFVILLTPTLAIGQQTSVTVLGLRSAASDETVAARVTRALRQAADDSGVFEHTSRENDLIQLMIVFDCDEPTDPCLQRIGESLETDTLIQGLLEPESGAAGAGYVLTLNYFDVGTGSEVRTLREVIPREISDARLTEVMAGYFAALTGTGGTPVGSLEVTCDVEGATVLLNGLEVGTTGAAPLIIEELEPGDVTLVVRHPERGEIEQSATIVADERISVAVELGGETTGPPPPPPPGGGITPRDGGRRSLAWLGWTTLGLGVAFGALGVYGSVNVHQANTDSVLATEIDYWVPTFNVCDEIEGGEPIHNPDADYTEGDVIDRCGSARTWQALQFAFYGLGAAAVGVGIWLLVREMAGGDDDEAQSALRLRVEPMVLEGGGALSARFAF